MSYCTQSQIETAIPPQHLTDALDDDRDGSADSGILDNIISQASQAVDALVAPRYETPFTDPAPAMVKEAAFVFTCELLYDRRQILENNPWRARADRWRERLEKIGQGEGSLDAALEEESGAQYGTANAVPLRLGTIDTAA